MLSATTLNRMLQYLEVIGVTAHDFSATAPTILNEKNYDEDWIEMQLAHVSGNKTGATYNHAHYLCARCEMLENRTDEINGWKI